MSVDREKQFEKLRFERSDYKEDLLKAFDRMERYLVKYKDELTLVGGQAMDYALRLKNQALYPTGTLPDYDCVCATHVVHAYQFANQLCSEGFKNIRVIRALHVQTMRVYVSGQVIMDCTYMPPVIYERLIRLEYRGISIIHPWYSMMDQLSALSHPYTRPPREALMERCNKDNKRLKMMLDQYPLDSHAIVLKGKRALPNQIQVMKPVAVKLVGQSQDYVWSGWCAFAYHCGVGSADTKTLKFRIPEFAVPSIYTTQIDSFTNTKGVKFYNPTMELTRHAHVNGVDIWDSSRRIITLDPKNPKFVSYQFLLWEFMARWLWCGDPQAFYAARQMVQHALDKKIELSIEPYGDRTLEDSFIFHIKAFGNPQMLRMAPGNYTYPDDSDCRVSKPFDYGDSEFFIQDGSETQRFVPYMSEDIGVHC